MFFSIAYAIKADRGFEALVDMPLEKFLDMIRELGYDGVEPNIANPFSFDYKSFLKEVSDRSLRVSAISTGLSYLTYGYSLSSRDEEKRRKAVEFFIKYFELAEALGAPRVVVGLARGKGIENEDLATLEKSLEEILSKTEGSDIVLLIEPLNRYETRILNDFIETANFVRKMRRIYGNRVGLLFDTFHACLECRSPYECFLEVKDVVSYIHVADSNRRAPGDGMIDWLKFLSIVKTCGYDDFVSVEAMPSPTIEDTIVKAANTLFPIARALGIK